MELLLPILLLLLLAPMFLAARRQKKEMQRTAEMQDSLQVGDRVMTTSGLYATVAGLEDITIDLEIAPGVVTTWARMAVREVVQDDENDATIDSADTAEQNDGGISFGKN
jgi:preprotein translocase subunit YajC